MADGFDIHLDADRAEKLKLAAQEAGLSMAEYALSVLDHVLDGDWAASEDALAEYDRTGEYVPLQEALAEFEAGLEAELVARGK